MNAPRLRVHVVAALLAGVVAGSALAQVPSGYRRFENKMKGFTFVYPITHEELPLQPTEQLVVAKYVMKQKSEDLKRISDQAFRAMTPVIEVYRFRLPTANTGAAGAAGESGGEGHEDGIPVLSWNEFLRGFSGFRMIDEPGKPDAWLLQGDQRLPQAPNYEMRGYMVRKVENGVTFVVLGRTFATGVKAVESQVTRMAASLKLADETAHERAEAEIDKLYASGQFRAVEWRKQARAKMAKGWKALDTENFLIVHHSTNLALVRRIARDVEAMRAFYATQFPPARPIEAVAVVRICRTADEYHEYGGPPDSGGYWHPANEELVFYDYSHTMKTLDRDQKQALGKKKLTDDDSLLVLYHEALHQYMHYAVGEFAPHDWFNEGFGDYYSGAVVGDSGKVHRVDPSPWRIHVAKDMCEHGDGYLSLRDVLHAERGAFYNPARASNYYAAAWSFVYFLKHAKEATQHPKWSLLLDTYFNAVKQSYAELAKDLDPEDFGESMRISALARKKALTTMLDGIDLPELEAAWRRYVIAMKDPWPSLRPKRK